MAGGLGTGSMGTRPPSAGLLLSDTAGQVWCLCSLPDVMEPEDDPEPSAGRQLRVRCGQLLACGQWHHLAVVVTKEMKRNCTVSTYLDGQVIGSAKVRWFSPAVLAPWPCLPATPPESGLSSVLCFLSAAALVSNETPLLSRTPG